MDNSNNPARHGTTSSTSGGSAKNHEEALQAELIRIRSENEQLRHELESHGNDQQKSSLPTREEIESISAMLDLVSKLDENMINKIQKLSKANIRNVGNS